MTSSRIQRQIDRLLDEADEAASQRRWDAVRDAAQHALTFDPDNADAQGFLAAAERALANDATSVNGDATTVAASPTTIPAPQAQPTSFAGGRYEVSKFLGEGGKKKVYLAHDAALDAFRAAGVTISREPWDAQTFWGRQAYIVDPSGYILALREWRAPDGPRFTDWKPAHEGVVRLDI